MIVTVAYVCSRRIEIDGRVTVLGGEYKYADLDTVFHYNAKDYDHVSSWWEGETGIMTLEQADLDLLVKHGLVVLGQCDTSS